MFGTGFPNSSGPRRILADHAIPRRIAKRRLNGVITPYEGDGQLIGAGGSEIRSNERRYVDSSRRGG